MGTRIHGGHLIDPANGIDKKTDLYIDNEGFVAGIGSAPEKFKETNSIDATGLIVCPGLVDLRVRRPTPPRLSILRQGHK
jgi:dihydroorotase